MTIKAILDKIDEAPELLRDHYVEANGKWLLQVDGVKTQADVDKVLAAKTKEVSEHATTKVALKTATDKLATLGDDVEARLQRLQTLDALGYSTAAEDVQRIAEALSTAKAATATAKLSGDLTTVSTERDAAVAENATLKARIAEREITSAIRDAATASRVLPQAIDALTRLGKSEFKLVDGNPQTEDGRDVATWLEGMKQATPFMWPLAQGAGAQGAHSGGDIIAPTNNPFSNESWNVTRQGELLRMKSDARRSIRGNGWHYGRRPAA